MAVLAYNAIYTYHRDRKHAFDMNCNAKRTRVYSRKYSCITNTYDICIANRCQVRNNAESSHHANSVFVNICIWPISF